MEEYGGRDSSKTVMHFIRIEVPFFFSDDNNDNEDGAKSQNKEIMLGFWLKANAQVRKLCQLARKHRQLLVSTATQLLEILTLIVYR